MYQSKAEFMMPDDIESLTQSFFTYFCQSFSSENANQNADALRTLEADTNMPFCLLEMIKEIIFNENEDYKIYLITATGYFNKFVQKRTFINYCNDNTEYKECLLSSILFLLPYLGNLFQETNEIIYFNHLFNGYYMLVDQYDEKEFTLFNEYIDFLLTNESMTSHQVIIVMIFISKFTIIGTNINLVTDLSNHLLSNFVNTDFTDDLEKIKYQIFFSEMNSILVYCFLDMKFIETNFLILSLDQFFNSFIKNYDTNQDIQTYNYIIGLIEQIIIFLMNFETESSSKLDPEAASKFTGKIISLIFKYSVPLIKSSNYLLSKSINQIFLLNAQNITITDENFADFSHLILSLAFFSQRDFEEIDESEEIFYYDFYNIDLDTTEHYSNRQNLAQLVYKFSTDTIPQIVPIMIDFLDSLELENISEPSFFLLSVLNLNALQQFKNDEEILKRLYEVNNKYLEIGSDMLDDFISNDHLNTIENIVFTYTYYFFINSCIFILNEDEIDSINSEIERLKDIIEAFSDDNPDENYNHIFFTLFCIIINELENNNQLNIPPDQIFSIVEKNLNLCYTNHAILIMDKFASQNDYVEEMLKAFDEYYDRCDKMIAQVKDRIHDNNDDDEDEEEEEEFEYPTNDYISNYIMRYFSDNVSKMANLIRNIDFSNFDEDKINKFSRFLIVTGDNFEFLNECIELLSAVLSKTPDLYNWTNFYSETILFSDRQSLYGEWVVPIINGISYQVEQVNQEYCEYILKLIPKCIKDMIEYGTLGQSAPKSHIIPTCDALYLYTLVTRVFEFTIPNEISNVQLSEEIVSPFLDIINNLLPTEKDCDDCDDYKIKDYLLGSNIMKLASLLTGPLMNEEEILQFLSDLANEGQIICNEIRYLIITLIDNIIKPDEESDLLELRKLCLENEFQGNPEYKKIYEENIQYNVANVPHPIYKLHHIEGFVFEEPGGDEDEKEEGTF